MRRRWSMEVLAAIALAVLVSSGIAVHAAARAHAAAPMEVTLALQSDGVALRVAHGRFVLKIEA